LGGKLLCVFIGADRWRCVLTDKGRKLREINFNTGPEEHMRSLLRGSHAGKAYVILSTEKSVIRFSKMPLMPAKEIKKAVSFLYEENFPVDKNKYIFGYKIIGKDPERYSLMLAALPRDAVAGIERLFNGMGVRIKTLGLFEATGGLSLSEFISILVFIKQEASWRVIWMKNKAPVDTWRVTGPADINALFAEMDFGETIDNALFYSPPDSWLARACSEYGLAVSETLNADDVFDKFNRPVNMLPAACGWGAIRRRAAIAAAALFLLAAAALVSAGIFYSIRTGRLQARHESLTAQIRSLNEETGNRPEAIPSDLTPDSTVYGRVLKVLAARLPAGVYIKHVSAADGSLGVTVSANGSGWLNGYIEDCKSNLGVNILASKISQANGQTEIEIAIEIK